MRDQARDPDEEDFRNDPLVRMAATIMDPLHGKPVPPSSVTPSELIELAARQRRRAIRRRLTWVGTPLLVAVLVVVVLVTAADFFSGLRHRPPAPAAAPASHAAPSPLAPPVPLPLSGARPIAARPQLVALTARTRACADRARPGHYTYVRTRNWSRQDAVSAPQAHPGVRDEQLWWAADRSGRQVVSDATGPVAGGVPGAPGFGSIGDYRPGELAVVVDSPSADPPILASQLADYRPFAQGPQAPLRAVVDLYRYHALDAAHRAAAIRVLADTTGLKYRGQVTDPLGRAGMAITVDSDRGGTRDVAVFAPATGQLLSYERDALRRPGSAAAVVVDYVVFVAAGYTDELGQPPGG